MCVCTCAAATLLVPQAGLSAHSVSHPGLDGRPGPTVPSVAWSWLVSWDNEEHQGPMVATTGSGQPCILLAASQGHTRFGSYSVSGLWGTSLCSMKACPCPSLTSETVQNNNGPKRHRRGGIRGSESSLTCPKSLNVESGYSAWTGSSLGLTSGHSPLMATCNPSLEGRAQLQPTAIGVSLTLWSGHMAPRV